MQINRTNDTVRVTLTAEKCRAVALPALATA
jgi:hypothetical protein